MFPSYSVSHCLQPWQEADCLAQRWNTRKSKTDDQGAGYNSEVPQGQSSIMVKCQFQKMSSHFAFYYCFVRFFLVNLFTCIQKMYYCFSYGSLFFPHFSLCWSGFYHPLLEFFTAFQLVFLIHSCLPSFYLLLEPLFEYTVITMLFAL